MTRKIKLYGPLKKICGVKEFEADVSNVDQVFSFIKVNYPDCKQHLAEAAYSVVMNDVDITFANLSIEGEGDIKVIPLISGNFFTVFLSTLFAGFINTAVTGTTALLYALAAGGLQFLADLLAPVPIDPATDPQVQSFLSNQTANTTKSGVAAPLVFGECLVGSVVISAGSDTVKVDDSTP
tara:strand:+ start:953 stop:1495 length:543 start_codon:yes stop_codon:yes gene_type:complete